MLMTFALATSALLSQLSFWLFVIGLVLLLMRGMGPPGAKSLDKKKYFEVKAGIEQRLQADSKMAFLEKFLLYCGKYFFVYLYYRIDLIFYWFVGGALIAKILSLLIEQSQPQ